MGMDRGNETTTQLLTLLNISATKAGKRKWLVDESRPKEKLNKRRVVLLAEPIAVKVLEDKGEDSDEEPEAQEVKHDKQLEQSTEDDEDDARSTRLTFVCAQFTKLNSIQHR